MNLTGQPLVVAGLREKCVRAVAGVFLRSVAAFAFSACLVSCKPQPDSIVVVHEGLSFASLSLPDQNHVNAPEFEKKLRSEIAQFATDMGIPFADNSEKWQQLDASYAKFYANDPEKLKKFQLDPRTRVSIGVYEKEVDFSVHWEIGPRPNNYIAFRGNGKAARSRQVFDALVQRLRSRNVPFEIENSPPEKS